MRTRLATLTLAVVLLTAGALPTLASPGPGGGDGSSHSGRGHGGSGPSGNHGSGRSDSEPGDDHGTAGSATAAAEPAPLTAAAEPAPPVGSVADRQAGFPRSSTPPSALAAAPAASAPPAARGRNQEVPAALDRALATLLTLDPGGRPATAGQVLALLAEAMPADAAEEDRPWPIWATGRVGDWQASTMARPPVASRPA